MSTKRRLSWIWVAVLALVVSGCSSASLGTPGTPDHQYRVALSMSYSGNDWQGEAANLLKLTAAKDPRITEFKQYISGTQAQNQISQLQQMILKKFDAIVIYPISPTALNQTIKQGCEAGILMMTYDAQVTEPCAHNITFDQQRLNADRRSTVGPDGQQGQRRPHHRGRRHFGGRSTDQRSQGRVRQARHHRPGSVRR